MRSAKKPPKQYWEMSKSELAAATREFDHESTDGFHELGPQKKAIWQRLQEAADTEPGDGLAPVRLRSADDVQSLRERIKQAAHALTRRLKKLAADNPLELLKDFKLKRLGYDPYDPGMEMNLVEQINQSATLLVACAAVERLLCKHPSRDGYIVSRPTARGYDLWARDVSVVGEVFAATSPGSNQKIRKDLDAILGKPKPPFQKPPEHRYVFFVCRSLEGFPPKKYPLTPSRNSHGDLGADVWCLVQDGTSAVTVVRLAEDAVFPE